jgi:hypothetical protein
MGLSESDSEAGKVNGLPGLTAASVGEAVGGIESRNFPRFNFLARPEETLYGQLY